jgi:hypothetical protein
MPRDEANDESDRGTELRRVLSDIFSRHDERMRTDPLYRQTVAIMKEATRPVEPSRHYDRDGYCDNPARGY